MAGKKGCSGGKRTGAGRPRKPIANTAPTLRKRVAIAAAAGMAHEEIAIALGIDRRTLETRFASELSEGALASHIEILVALHAAALAGSVPAARFILKNSPALSVPPQRLGKKEAAQRAARSAQEGTKWAGLLPPVSTKQ